MNKIPGILFVLLFAGFLGSCDSDLSWTPLFQDNFTGDFRTDAHTYNDTGLFSVAVGEAVCQGTNCGCEYEGTGDSPNSTKIKMSLKFKISEAFDTDYDRVGVSDPNDLGDGECEHFAGVVYVSGETVLTINVDGSLTPLASAAVTLTPDTYYYIEFIGNEGELTATLKNASGDQIEQVTGSVSTVCTYKEAAFNASDEGSGSLVIRMDDFEVSTSD